MNHIATGRALSLGENYSHMVMVSTLDGEVDEEVQPGVEAAARSSHGAAAASGGGGPWPPFFFLGDGAAMEELFPSLAAAKRRKIRGLWWLFRVRVSFFIWTLGFPSPLLGFHQNGPTDHVRTPIGLITGLKSSYGKL